MNPIAQSISGFLTTAVSPDFKTIIWSILSGILVALAIFLILIWKNKLGRNQKKSNFFSKSILIAIFSIGVVGIASYFILLPRLNQNAPAGISTNAPSLMVGFPSTGTGPAAQTFVQFLKSLYTDPIDGLITLLLLILISLFSATTFKKIIDRKRIEQDLENAKIAARNVLEDLSVEKSKYEILARDLEKFRLAVEHSSEHTIITDENGTILYANPAAQEITGYSLKEMIGQKSSLWGNRMNKDFYERMWHTIKDEHKVFIGEINNRRKNGEEYIAHIEIAPVLDENKKIIFFVGIEYDITKAKQIDKSKSEFVSLASHQLRTPLSAINWYTEMLMDEDVGKLNEKQRDYLQEIYRSSKRMAALVSSLLNVSRIEMGTFAIEPKSMDVVALIKSIIEDLAPQIEKKGQTLTEDYRDVGMINIDPNLMRTIVQNLVSNAVKYTQKGGQIKISIDKNHSITLDVSDNGYGIPQNQQSHIFSKFFRADNAKEKETDGNGLGLYMVKEVVKKAGGRIWFESEENKGTTFHVSIPLTGMIGKPGEKQLL